MRSQEHVARVQRVTDTLSYPWGMAILPDGERALITEKITAIVKLVDLQNGAQIEIARIGDVTPLSAGDHCGLLDISLHPNFTETSLVYLAYTTGTASAANIRPRLSRARFHDNQLIDIEPILTLESGSSNSGTCGMRMAWLPDNTLLMSVGHAESSTAQDPTRLRGKIIRINDDGSPAQGNPTDAIPGARPEIYSLGHRDPQGVAVDSSGRIWAVEHGPYGGDELNIIQPGGNYGWPQVSYGVHYPRQSPLSEALEYIGLKNRIPARAIRRIGDTTHADAGFIEPVAHWGADGSRSIAPSGMLIYSGRQFDRWRHNLLIATLYKRHIRRVVIADNRPIHQERLLTNRIGRIRHLVEAPDGTIYVLTDSPNGSLFRLTKKR